MNLPGPGDLLRVAGSGYRAVEQAIGLLPRVVTMLDRMDSLIERVDALVDSVETTAGRAESLVGTLEPTMTKLQPILATLAETTSPDEVAALVAVIDLVPELGESLREDIMPILGTLDTVGPDLSNLLLVSTELNEMLSAIPGLGRAKKKFEEDQLEQQQDGTNGANSDPAADPAVDGVGGPALGELTAAEQEGFEKS